MCPNTNLDDDDDIEIVKPKKKVVKSLDEDEDESPKKVKKVVKEEETEEDEEDEKPVKKSNKKFKTNLGAVKRILGSITSNDKFWKPQVGSNQIRVLPSNTEDGLPFHLSILHHGFSDAESNRAYPCLQVFKQSCPACKVISFYDGYNDSDIESIRTKILPKKTYLMNIIDRAEPNKVRIYSCSPSVAQVIIGAFSEEDYGDITDPEEGFDVVIKRDGQGLKTKYKTLLRRNPTPIGVDNWEEQLFNLEKEAYREIPSYNKFCEIIEQQFGDTLTNLEKCLKKKKAVKDEESDDDDLGD